MRAELCRRSEGSTGWAGREGGPPWLGWEVSLQAPSAGSLLDEGPHCSLDKTWSAKATGQEWRGGRKESRPPT